MSAPSHTVTRHLQQQQRVTRVHVVVQQSVDQQQAFAAAIAISDVAISVAVTFIAAQNCLRPAEKRRLLIFAPHGLRHAHVSVANFHNRFSFQTGRENILFSNGKGNVARTAPCTLCHICPTMAE
jgi:hypothetical protein